MARERSDEAMRIMMLQESVWDNGDKLNRILEHVISHEAELFKVRKWLEQIRQHFNGAAASDSGSEAVDAS